MMDRMKKVDRENAYVFRAQTEQKVKRLCG